jgi:hypothetical protein
MVVEGFDFSCLITLPDGTVVEVQQTDVRRDERQGMTFVVTVTPQAAASKPFTGALHLSGASLTNLDACPGDTHAEKSARVSDALRAWVREHGVSPEFALDVRVGDESGYSHGVSISPQ